MKGYRYDGYRRGSKLKIGQIYFATDWKMPGWMSPREIKINNEWLPISLFSEVWVDERMTKRDNLISDILEIESNL